MIVGDRFIGLEVAASLRARGLAVDVIARDAGPPMTRILGEALGKMVQTLHEAHGVVFHFDATLAEIAPDHVKLSTG
ncbi:FAD-dependent oxidoreductase, partial [Escherichia coli]|uniref:FAD-dependent oxidoreductase n=1 Tax=Escherichia coli TaxID=562 RepID=UPI00256EC8CF